MPTAPPMVCSTPGCPGRRQAGAACPTCGKGGKREAQRTYDRQRGTSTERGYGSYWEAQKEEHLRNNPVCVCCEVQGRAEGRRGRTGLRVDHIVPKRIAPDLFNEPTNWQTLCLHCDMSHKQPLEKRCRTAEQVLAGWAEAMERLRREAGVR